MTAIVHQVRKLDPRNELTPVPGNIGLNRAEENTDLEIFQPYHDRIEELNRRQTDRPGALVSMHSFTPYLRA
jgi:predicted N-formylglutamate amidohydrolase